MSHLLFIRSRGTLIGVGLICTVYGIIWIRQGIEGDTLCPGTSFTYLPRWLFIGAGLLAQLPLPAAIWFLSSAGAP